MLEVFILKVLINYINKILIFIYPGPGNYFD